MNRREYFRRPGLLYLGFFALVVLAIAAPSLRACQTPVFRYALEKWPVDYYPLLVYHDAPLSDEDQKVIDWLEEVQETEGSQISLHVLDISKPTSQPASQPATQPDLSPAEAQNRYVLKRFPPPADVQMPAMILRYSARPGPKGAVWPVVYSGRLNGKLIRSVMNSPARKEVAKRILSGDSSVWILVESGAKAKDEAAAKTLQTGLALMNKELQLPEQPPAPPAEEGYEDDAVSIELKVAFTMLRISRTDPAEKMFVKMLLGSEDGLDKGEPVAFPIYGRGRALAGFVGDEIEAENIEDACVFMVGRCSCQVKNLNPGTDMMFSVDWDAALMGEKMMTMPDPPKFVTDEVDAKDVTLMTDDELATTQPAVLVGGLDEPTNRLPLIIGASIAALVLVVGFPMVRVMRKEAGR
jgi:hypothetical protein